VLNDEEAFQLTDKSNIVRASEAILEMGPRFVVVKKGEHGAFMMHRENGQEHMGALPAYAARDVVDPTGAGDSFAGGMMGHIAAADDARPATLRTAMAYGTLVASYNIESFSVHRMREIGKKNIDQRMKTYRELLDFQI
jgi:sugar/nucleoside kinase (ribokinase family)